MAETVGKLVSFQVRASKSRKASNSKKASNCRKQHEQPETLTLTTTRSTASAEAIGISRTPKATGMPNYRNIRNSSGCSNEKDASNTNL